MQVGLQGRRAKKAGGQTRQVGQQGSWAGWIDVVVLTANTFAAATCNTDKTKQGNHYSLFFNMMSMELFKTSMVY
jgi:hypothetical protein